MKKHTYWHWLDLAFALALLLKLFGAGFSYFCVLDDYIQYGSYPMFDLSHVYLGIGTIAARPFAALLDPAFWGLFFPHMAFALLLLGALHLLSAFSLNKVLCAHGIKITPVLYSVYLLLPLSFEGTYWISASTRIVVGMFFAALATHILNHYLTTHKKKFLPLYAAVCLLSFGFYESVLIFSGILQLFVLGKHVMRTKHYKKLLLLSVPATCALLFLVYYRLAQGIGAMGSRASGLSFANFELRLLELVSQFVYIFTVGLFRTTVVGFMDGIKHLASSPLYGITLGILVLAISALCAYLSKKHKLRAKSNVCVSLGFALTFFPLLPNVLVADVWLTYRSIVVCLPGICLLLAPLLAMLLKNRYVRMSFVFLTVFVFSIGCINEAATYKKVNETDLLIVTNVIHALDEDVVDGKKGTVLVLPHEVIVPQTSYYKDHVKSVSYSDWSLTGAVRAMAKNNRIQMITPVFSLDGIDTEGKLILYMDDSYQITEVSND